MNEVKRKLKSSSSSLRGSFGLLYMVSIEVSVPEIFPSLNSENPTVRTIKDYTVQPAQVRNLMKCPYFFIIGRFGDFLS